MDYQSPMRTLIFLLILVLPFISCTKSRGTRSDSVTFLAANRLAELTDKKLGEVSGLAASSNNPGLLWVHNDSGNDAEIYLVDENLKIRLSCKIPGVKNRDWEDIAVGPGPEAGKNYVYVADIGDNKAKHPFKYIYRFVEPVASDQSGEINITKFDTIVFRLEGERKDTESIMIHPVTKDLYVVSKREKPVYLYELKYPYSVQDTLTAAKVTSLPLTQIVSAGISTDGKEILMKNYDNIYYWNIQNRPVKEALQEKPEILKYTPEPQGEAITFTRDGSGFYTLSEKVKGEKTFLYYYERMKR